MELQKLQNAMNSNSVLSKSKVKDASCIQSPWPPQFGIRVLKRQGAVKAKKHGIILQCNHPLHSCTPDSG